MWARHHISQQVSADTSLVPLPPLGALETVTKPLPHAILNTM